MKALDAYKGLLKELDKHESPTFSIGDFNYFFNKSVQDYITENYKDLDPVQKDVDDIRSIIRYNKPLEFEIDDTTRFKFPEDYQHILYIQFTCKFLKDAGKYKKDSSHTFTEVRREKTSQRGTRNSYRKTSYLRPYYRMDGSYIYPVIDTNILEIEGGKLDYIHIPPEVYLNPDKSSDYNSDDNNTPIGFSNYVVNEIIDICKVAFLENIESQRFQASLVENKVNKSE